MVVKVHYTYTLALAVPRHTTLRDLREQLAHKVGQAAPALRLR